MAEILLFHHALGLTDGVLQFADDLRAADHVVHTPDLYEGKTFTAINDGVAHAQGIGFRTVIELGKQIAENMPNEIVYAGMSMGVMPAQLLTMTRPGTKGALLLHSSVPLSEFGGAWPEGVPVQLHTMEDDEWGDAAIARELAAAIPTAELFLYPGDKHLFTDTSLPDQYDEPAAALLQKRVLSFLDNLK